VKFRLGRTALLVMGIGAESVDHAHFGKAVLGNPAEPAAEQTGRNPGIAY